MKHQIGDLQRRPPPQQDAVGNGMMGYLGMSSPNFIADAMLYKMKQSVLDSANPNRHFENPLPGDRRVAESKPQPAGSNFEANELIRDLKQQNDLLKRREREREERMAAMSAGTLKKNKAKNANKADFVAEDLPQLPKKKAIPINNLKMGEVFDPFQFIAKTNISTCSLSNNRSLRKLDAVSRVSQKKTTRRAAAGSSRSRS